MKRKTRNEQGSRKNKKQMEVRIKCRRKKEYEIDRRKNKKQSRGIRRKCV